MATSSETVTLKDTSGFNKSTKKKWTKWQLIALVLAVVVVVLIIIIAIIAWLLVDVSIKGGDDDSSTAVTSGISLPGGIFVSFDSHNEQGSGTGILFRNPNIAPVCLIAIHAWWGMTADFQKQCAMMARDGDLTVLAVDIYRGEVEDNREDASHRLQGLDWSGAIDDMSGAARYLNDKGCRGVGIVGFCAGGALSLAAAANSTGISAAASFYGIPSTDQADVTTVKLPLQGHYGSEDMWAGDAAYNALKEKVDAAGGYIEIFQYDGAGHGFANIGEDNYRKAPADLSMKRLYKFMHDNL